MRRLIRRLKGQFSRRFPLLFAWWCLFIHMCRDLKWQFVTEKYKRKHFRILRDPHVIPANPDLFIMTPRRALRRAWWAALSRWRRCRIRKYNKSHRLIRPDDRVKVEYDNSLYPGTLTADDQVISNDELAIARAEKWYCDHNPLEEKLDDAAVNPGT